LIQLFRSRDPEGISASYGLWANPVTGHLLADTNLGVVDIDPISGTVVLVGSPPGNVHGVTVSPDGKTAYVETNSNAIYAYNIPTPDPLTPLATFPELDSPSGLAVISGGTYDGFIVVNNNDGTVGMINPLSGIETIIATGGSTGALVGPDLTNGTLFLAFNDEEERLGIKDGSIGSPEPTAVPEPASLAFFVVGIAGLAALSRRRKAKGV
jgi:hypothetical protein